MEENEKYPKITIYECGNSTILFNRLLITIYVNCKSKSVVSVRIFCVNDIRYCDMNAASFKCNQNVNKHKPEFYIGTGS